jgi:GNAT superfamily N-acetyltransferase
MNDEPKPTLQIRRATLDDLALIVRYNCLMAAETEGITLSVDTVTTGVRSILEDPTKGFYLIVEGSDEDTSIEDLYSGDGTIQSHERPSSPGCEPVGQCMITYEWSDWRCGDFWWIQSVYIQPEWRRRGAFRTLFEYVKIEADKRVDVVGLRLYTASTNSRAKGVYSRLGMDGDRYVVYELEKDDPARC